MGNMAVGSGQLGIGVAMGPACGRLTRIDDNGRAWVELPAIDGSWPARCVVPESAVPPRELLQSGTEVLLVFEDCDPRRPVIVGFLRDRLWPREPATPVRTLIEGRQELVLRCGEASMTMAADGKVVIKGTRIVSRASESNKVRGAVVLIN